MPSTSEIPPMDRVNLLAVRARLGRSTTERGSEYFHAGRVGPLRWQEEEQLLVASVSGSRRVDYVTVLQMVMRDGRPVDLEFGQCSCPVGYDCKHVFAVLTQAVHLTSAKLLPGQITPAAPDWAQALSGLRTSRHAPAIEPSSPKYGIQLALSWSTQRSGYLRLLARPVTVSARGAWVTTGISWDRLPYSYSSDSNDQIRLLDELYSAYRAKSRNSYYYNQSATIDLSEISGRILWDILAEAAEHDVALVNSIKTLGHVAISTTAGFDVDITVLSSGDLSVVGRTVVGDTLLDGSRFGFLGPDGTGLVHWDAGAPEDVSQRSFGLARLETPVLASLHGLATSDQPLIVPHYQRATFTSDYLPALRMDATVVSSDDSYRQPVIVGPELQITVEYTAVREVGGGVLHTVATRAEWHYSIDEVEILIDAGRPIVQDGTREPAREQSVLDSVREVLGDGRVVHSVLPPFAVTGIRAAHYLKTTVPLLRAVDRVEVRITGDPPDFADATDTVTVSLSTRSVSGTNDWFDLGIVVAVDDGTIALADIITAVAQGESHILLSDGRYVDLESPTLSRLRELVEEARSLQDSPDGPLRLSRYQATLWEELVELGVVTRQAKAWRAQVSDLLALDRVQPIQPPSTLQATLRSYQNDGLTWLSFLHDHGLGGILADDMGLGKTIQTLALIARVQERSGIDAPFLIIAPSSVVHNWAREAAQFTPTLTIATAAETTSRRGSTVAQLAAGADVLITSYTIFRLNFDEFDASTWSGLVLDEAQFVKNHQGKSHQCARRLTTPFKLAITGTPMENNVMELWALLSITAPGLFPSPKKFTELYRKPIENGGDTDVLKQLRRRIRPLVLRRTKELVAVELPPKQEQTVEVDLHPRHRRLYDTTLNRERQKILGLIDDLDKNRFTILKSLTLLRQLSLDASLIDPEYAAIPSAKTDELIGQLTEVAAGGHRALVFSQFTQYLGRVRSRLQNAGIEFEYLDGKTRKRADVVERFRSGAAPVFLISLKAGGVGLTLTEADYCFVLDPWWNPATEMQAVDRAHRIGQKKTVFVNRYVSRGTIEEKVMDLKKRKSALISGVMDDGDAFDGGLTADDIRALID
ncbi:DEAD/DEAH box helicase [Rhodococcus sp. Leaf278]|uniref:DEAD/DEAH box helicase n=1 Tax=Rhodococcus sp. Leaf278 TaxID=1736319 RepID=UPI0012E36B64|nr:DEAD/DEAH box helicase [Rhodococcus sp. Leaf278]